MNAELLVRLRANDDVIAAAGVFNGRPALDWMVRHSDDPTAFPAATLQVIAETGEYDQDGRSGLEQPRIRVTAFGTSYEQTREFYKILRTAIETPGAEAGVRFHRAELLLSRDMPPKKQGATLTIYGILGDFRVPATIGD